VILFLPDKRAFAAKIMSKFIFYPKVFVFIDLSEFNIVQT
jgi:hypothetical protein